MSLLRRDPVNNWGETGTVTAIPAHLVLGQYTMAFSDTIGGADAPTQLVSVTSTAGAMQGVTVGTITYNSGSGWLTTSVVPGLPAVVNITAVTGALAAGTYTAVVPITDPNADNNPQEIDVTFTVNAAPQPPIISPSQSSFTFTGTAGGAVTATQTFTVTNVGGGSFTDLAVGNVVYGSGSGWLTGSLAGNTVSGYADPSALAAGNYTATFDITDSGASNSPVTIGVSFAVSAVVQPTMSFTSTQPNFSGIAGQASPATQAITVTDSSGAGTLAGPTVGAITYGSGSGWLTTATMTTNTAGSNYTLTVGVTTGALAAGTYTATFPVTDASATNSPVTVTVTFVVSAVTQPGNFPAPLYSIMQGTSANATFDSSSNLISYNPFTNNGITDPEGDATSASYYYTGATTLTATSLAQLNTACATAAANPSTKYIISVTADFSTGSNWTLPAKTGSLWTLIQGSAALPTLEADRPTAADFASARTITFTGSTVDATRISLAAGSDGWHFRDLHFKNQCTAEQATMLKLGLSSEATTTADMPERIKIERCYLNNPFDNVTYYVARGINVGARYVMIRRNYIAGMCKNGSSDSQGIIILNTLGDIQIEDNFIEGASECINLGGGTQWMGTQNYIHNVHIRGNYLFRRAAWMTSTTGVNGGSTVYGQVKNFFEIKCGRYVVFEDNYMENHNAAGQQNDIVLKVSPYSSAEVAYLRTQDITIRNNYGTASCGGACEVSSGDDHPPLPSTALPVERIEIRNNAFVNPRTNTNNTKRHMIGGKSDLSHRLANVVFNHNWFSLNAEVCLFTPTPALCLPGFVFTNNINATANTYQLVGSAGAGNNDAALNAYCGNRTTSPDNGPSTWIVAKNCAVHAAGATHLYGATLPTAPHANLTALSVGTPGSGAITSTKLGAQLNADRSVKTTSTVANGSPIPLYHTASDYTSANGLSIGPDWAQLTRALAATT